MASRLSSTLLSSILMSLLSLRPALVGAPGGRPTLGSLGAGAEEELLGLGHEHILCLRVGQAQAIVVDDQDRLIEPHLPGCLRHLLVDALAELAGVGRGIKPRQLAAELHTVDHSGHGPPHFLPRLEMRDYLLHPNL